MRGFLIGAAASIAALVPGAQTGHAQQVACASVATPGPTPSDRDIIVTAQRRERNLLTGEQQQSIVRGRCA